MGARVSAAVVGLCIVLPLIACRPADPPPPTPDHESSNQAGNTSTSQPAPGGLIARTPPTQPEFIPSPNNLLRVRYMVLSVTLFTLAHELGHMVAEEYKLPMTGKPEDSADRFATLLMTPNPKPAGSPPDTFDPVTDPDSPQVVWAAWFWNEMWRRKQERGELPDYANRHGLDISRSVEVMCLTYGLDPDRFRQPFRAFIREDNHDECVADSKQNAAAWQQVFARPLGTGSWWKYQARVSYNSAPPALDATRNLLVGAHMLEQIAALSLDQMWVPEASAPQSGCSVLSSLEPCRLPIDLVADSCPGPDDKPTINAFWVRGGARQMVLCYGLVKMIDDYARETIARTEIGQREKMPGPQ